MRTTIRPFGGHLSDAARRLLDAPDGYILDYSGPYNRYVIQKTGSVLALYFTHPSEDPSSSIMSEIDLLDPLNLLFGYSRAFMLSLVWMPTPQRICMIGLAGGRIPMVLRHFLPDARIDAAEIDPDVIDVARTYFGLQLDDLFHVALQDGREYLGQVAAGTYDIIFVDAFAGSGIIPHQLATAEFYKLCRSRLRGGGIAVVNLCTDGPLHRARVETFRSVFENVYLVDYDTALVLFGTDQPALSVEQVVERTAALCGLHQFPFPLLTYAHRVVAPAFIDNTLPQSDRPAEVLRDSSPLD